MAAKPASAHRAQMGAGEPGIWFTDAIVTGRVVRIPIDLIVPENAASPGGRRGARLGAHGNRAARRAKGLEAALIDHEEMAIIALDPRDDRTVPTKVAGPVALLIAKAYKIHDRLGSCPDRSSDKDGADIYRLMRTHSTEELRPTVQQLLGDERTSSSAEQGFGASAPALWRTPSTRSRHHRPGARARRAGSPHPRPLRPLRPKPLECDIAARCWGRPLRIPHTRGVRAGRPGPSRR